MTSLFPASEAVLPDEITKELEALSLVDDARKSRIERLEKLRRREDVLPGGDAEDDDDDMRCDQSLHESAESSVEGKRIHANPGSWTESNNKGYAMHKSLLSSSHTMI